jgi:DNA-binding beta-propeller fold protein YncE
MFVPATRIVPPLVYVPNAATGAADMIDQRTGRRIGRVPVGGAPALLVPDHDLRRLWVSDPVRGLVQPIGPRSARRGKPLRISRPGTLYFTPDGRAALVLTGPASYIDFRHPRTMDLLGTVRLPCKSVLRADFSADGSSLLATCPTSRKLVRVAPGHRAVTGAVKLPRGSRPGDLRLSPDGRTFFVADPAKGGLWTVDAVSLRPTGFVRTGPGAHGLMFDRAYRRLFVTGGKGTVSAVDVVTRRVSQLWQAPGGRPLEPGGVSSDGHALWLSDPSAGRVYALSTRTGRPLHDVRVGGRPGSPCVYPQPGRYSLGGPGLYR